MLVKDVGEFKVGIAAMNIAKAIADFDFRRKNKTGEIKIKANTCFNTIIIFINLYQFFRLARALEARSISIFTPPSIYTRKFSIRSELNLNWNGNVTKLIQLFL